MNRNLPTIVGILFLVVGLVTGVILVKQNQYFGLSAQGSLTPVDPRITNVTDSSFTVSFYTERPSISGVKWGEKNFNNFSTGENTSLKTIHHITVRDLDPNTTYKFIIQSGGEEFLNQGIPWLVKTSSVSDEEIGKFISGNIYNGQDSFASGAIVYLQIGGASTLSTEVSSNGSFVLPLNKLRDQSLTRSFQVNDETLINLFVQGGSSGVANAQILFESANPVPNIMIGKSYDFTKLEGTGEDSLPSAEVSLPEVSQESRFELTDSPRKTN